ncbi:MAG: hypothetical protein BroJett040_17660 [Oligoflexia bacterium]|nr:MAG: hypothetical protein BroJett040_17660 [Oligoflexia bacterium]
MNKQGIIFGVIILISTTFAGAVEQSKKKQQKKSTPQVSQQKATSIAHKALSKDRGGSVQIDKKQTALPKYQELQGKKIKSTVDLKQVKPPKTSSFMVEDGSDDKAKLERITDQQIDELYNLTKKFKTSPRRGELWLRLAELYVEKAGLIDFRRQTEYDKRLRDYQDGKTKMKPTLDLKDAHEYNLKAIQLYEWFVRDFPKDEKLDQALFFLGYNSYEVGQVKKGTEYYTRLTKNYPQSPYIVEANFALAEYYFENEQWKKALASYLEVVKNKKHRLFSFSMYKVAWCYFRSGETTKALKNMEYLVRYNRDEAAQSASNGKKIVSKAKLEGEGLRDIVLFYSEVGAYDKAPAYFQNLAGKDALGYLEKLAYLYADRGNREGARHLFNYLIQQNPSAPKAFDYKYQIVQGYSNATKTREFREELYSWIRDFGVGSAWYQANKSNTELTQNSEKLRETTLRNWILQQHQTAQNSRAKFSQSLAQEGYYLYLKEFPQATAYPDMHFYYAELLYDMQKYDEAGTHYRWVVDNAPQSKYAAKAAENIVLALEKNMPKDEEISKSVGNSVEPVAFNPRIEKFVQASQWYISKFPNTEKVADIKFRVGRLYYQHNQFDQAIPYFKEIVQKYPKTKYAEYSANLLLDIYNLKKDYVGMEKTGLELLAIPAIASSKAGADIKGVMEKASFKRAQDLEGTKDYQKSAEQFEYFAKQNPHSPLAVTAHFNAGVNYERAGQNSRAISNHLFVVQSKDKSADQFKPKSHRILAKLYQDAGLLEEAAVMYKKSAHESGSDPLVPNLHYNAAILYEALGRNTEAVGEYDQYFQKSKKADKFETVYQVAQIYRRAGQNQKAIQKFKEYVQFGSGAPEKIMESTYLVYELALQSGDPKLADQWRRKTLSTQKQYAPNKKGIGAQYAAKILMEDALVAFAEMKSITIPGDPAKQKKAAQKKIGMMTQMNTQLADIIKYDSPEEIVGALSVLGQANLHMGESLVGAPLPPGLNPQETEQYKAGIAKLAEPFFIKAKESLKAAIDRGSELEVYNKHYRRAGELLVKMDPSFSSDQGELPMEMKQAEWVGL